MTMTEDSLECEEDATIAAVDYAKSVPRADSARYSRRLVDRARRKEENDSRQMANDDQTATAEESETVRMTDSTEQCQNESVNIGRTANDIFDEWIATSNGDYDNDSEDNLITQLVQEPIIKKQDYLDDREFSVMYKYLQNNELTGNDDVD